ncbi:MULTISPECIES: hypothetical protein [Streptomyces]|uniref:hypothetical protein n=1 Tax=Streptomyces TaxID=1883 RepID=UPI000F6D9F2D|nr:MULTISPECIES: hypothetical protein [unclassified Streptomyces]AZM89284.1 hypothetical protein D1J60_12950 [Streptomyces sp. W1SF4]RSS65996.1 hypothetical protein EF912_00530 [Streptomyces sp. WAC07061]
MRRGPVHAMAWVLATAAAVTLSWWGVHTVMSGTAYDPPRAVPLTARAPDATPSSSSTRAPDPTPSPSGSPSASPSASASAPDRAGAAPSASARSKQAPAPGQRPYPEGGQGGGSGTVKSYSVSGGRVVFDLGATSAGLVSATPEAGWRMQVWKQDFWIRVTFTQGSREVSVFCTWHDHPPMVETVDP